MNPDKSPWHKAEPRPVDIDGEDAAMGEQADQPAAGGEAEAARNAGLLLGRLDRWLRDMESLRLADYVRYVGDRRRLIRSSFYGGVARGVGMAVGFTILGAVLVLILQDLAKHNLPLIGDMLAKIVSIVQNRLE